MSFFHSFLSIGSGVVVDPGLEWLQDNAYFFTDLSLLGGGLTLANGNSAFEDVSINNRDCILAGTPTRATVLLDSKNFTSTLSGSGTNNALNLQYNGYAWMQSNSFRWLFMGSTNDGQPPTNPLRLFGTTISPGGAGIQVIFNTNGTLRIDISHTGLNTWTSTSAVLTNGANALFMLDITFDFSADTITILKNGVNVTGSWTAGNISNYIPASYAIDHPFFMGNKGTNGVVSTTNGSNCNVVRCAVVPTSLTVDAINYFKKLIMPSYSLSADTVTGDMIGLSGSETSIFGNPIYNQYMYYGVTDEINPGSVRQYSIAVAELTSPNTATKMGVILNRNDIGLTGSLEGILPMGIYVKETTIYIFCTVNIQAGGNATGLCTASTSDPLTLTYQGIIIDDGTNGTRFNHACCPFDNPDDLDYIYAIHTHRDNDTLPLKARVLKSLRSSDLETWVVIYNDVIFTTDPAENIVYYNIERRSGVWKLMFGSFNATGGGFSIWQTASNTLQFFPEGNELLPPNLTDEEYTSKPLLSLDRTRMYYARRAGGASTNYIGIRVKLSTDFNIDEDVY